ncbi:hypothetical protein [Glutamicibacter sp. NPDC087344]
MTKRQDKRKNKYLDSAEFSRNMRQRELKNHVPPEMYFRIR